MDLQCGLVDNCKKKMDSSPLMPQSSEKLWKFIS